MNRVNFNRLHLAVGAGLVVLATSTPVPAKSFGDWSTPANIESLPGSSNALNTPAVDGCASHSRDGLTLVFNSNRAGNFELYMATRSNTSEGFGDPVRLPSPVNGPGNEACATITNGKNLYFSSDRDDPAYDLYVTRLGPKGWGREVMIFTRRVGPAGKLYQSVDGGPATLVQGGPHSGASDVRASVTHDGRTIFWDSTRAGSQGPDIWYATRSNTSETWGQAVHLTELSPGGQDLRPFISWDGTFLTMSSNRTGSESPAPDIWFATR